MKRRLEGKVAVITGGNAGIGLASAKEFVNQGAKVAILARSQDKLDKALADIGKDAVGFLGDVADLASLKAFYEEVAGHFGKIDIVFANAGIADRGFLEEVDEEHFDRMVDVNFKGAFFTVQYALPYLREGASIVLTSSCLDEMGMASVPIYSATKAAVRSLARSLTPSLNKLGVRINVLSPGPVTTEIEKKSGVPVEEVEAYQNSIGSMLAAGRMGHVDEMAAVAVFMASDESSFMYGSEIQADGGMNQTRWIN
jgi:NAD(P)-dependent dehydrogenase (short-subunit alcohol dehydrogenase family)